jgi:hypothetical protein
MEGFLGGVSTLGCLLLGKKFPRGYFSLSDLIEQTLPGMCHVLGKDVVKEWMLQPMKMIKNI